MNAKKYLREIEKELDKINTYEQITIPNLKKVIKKLFASEKLSNDELETIKGISKETPRIEKICKEFNKQHENDIEYQKTARNYELSKLQIEEMSLWIDEHRKKCKLVKQHKKYMKNNTFPPCDGWCDISLKIVFSSIANLLYVKCACGESHYLGEV